MIAFTPAARARKRAARLAAILDHLANHPDSGGWDICKGVGVSSGSLYPELARLEQDGRVTSRWADGPEPRRRLYRLAADEAAAAEQARVAAEFGVRPDQITLRGCSDRPRGEEWD